jgi:hypothetical protein
MVPVVSVSVIVGIAVEVLGHDEIWASRR